MSDDWRDKLWDNLRDMVEQDAKTRMEREDRVLLVNKAMYDKLGEVLADRCSYTDNHFGLLRAATINFDFGGIEVHVIGPLQYSLYGDKNPDTSALLVSRDAWDFMCGHGKLWEEMKKRWLSKDISKEIPS